MELPTHILPIVVSGEYSQWARGNMTQSTDLSMNYIVSNEKAPHCSWDPDRIVYIDAQWVLWLAL